MDGKPPDSTVWFFDWLNDVVDDFRVHKTALARIRFAIFGVGDSTYGNANYNKVHI